MRSLPEVPGATKGWAPPFITLVTALACAATLGACGQTSGGDAVGTPPLTSKPAPTTRSPTTTARSPVATTAPTTTLKRSPTTTAAPVAPAPKSPLLPKGEHSGLGNTPSGQPWDLPGTAEQAAAKWVVGFYEVLWDQPGPLAWAKRVRPYTAPAYWRVISRGAVTSSAEAASWHKVVAEHELDQVDVLSAYRVNEAGYSATRQVVLVDYDTSVRTNANPDAPPGPAQPISLKMVRQGGRWLVAGTWSPLSQPSP